MFFLYKEEKNLNYRVFGKDKSDPYDTNVSLNLMNNNIIEDFYIHSDDSNNQKCMLVSNKELKVFDLKYN